MEHLIQSIESALQTNNNYAALAIALALPDICGWIRDPTKKVQIRYESWFEEYMAHKYVKNLGPNRSEQVFLTGADLYALRCAYLHEGREDITEQRASEILKGFYFVVPPEGWEVHCNKINNTLQLQLDIFCHDVIESTRHFLKDIGSNKDAQTRLNQSLVIRDIHGIPLLLRII